MSAFQDYPWYCCPFFKNTWICKLWKNISSYWFNCSRSVQGSQMQNVFWQIRVLKCGRTTAELLTCTDFHKGCIVVQLVALLPCNKKVLGSTPSMESFCMEFACSPCVGVGSHWVVQHPPTVQKHDC
ncbi:hypothetical protein AMECASPLE_037658 [Ameca splendens]|uniref:Uncharacterized protein n=1 Tax=Ameca splendens TaxID=208324 RepID=A0ABV0ZTH7_9TELE